MEMQFENFFEKHERPYIIAGPCSAETEQQVLSIAHELREQNIDYYRAGIWKPRTKPGSFEGVGALGLKWLRRVKEETGLKVTTEVANKVHVDECLYHDIDALWIGARTTVNPFSVQEVADALKGVDIPVMIKNPINADLQLWIGGIERLYKAGINKIAAIHRGFSAFGEKNYRNHPTWQIPIELKSIFPNLVVINDNSHICGRRDILRDVAQEAMDLNFDGIMTEVHIDPDNAWSDAKQQITPAQFKQLVDSLIIRDIKNINGQNSGLSEIRAQIDHLDDDMLRILDERMKLAQKIGQFKKENNIAILQPERWNQILEKSAKKAENLGLSDEFVKTLFRAVHQESINHQEEIMKNA